MKTVYEPIPLEPNEILRIKAADCNPIVLRLMPHPEFGNDYLHNSNVYSTDVFDGKPNKFVMLEAVVLQLNKDIFKQPTHSTPVRVTGSLFEKIRDLGLEKITNRKGEEIDKYDFLSEEKGKPLYIRYQIKSGTTMYAPTLSVDNDGWDASNVKRLDATLDYYVQIDIQAAEEWKRNNAEKR